MNPPRSPRFFLAAGLRQALAEQGVPHNPFLLYGWSHVAYTRR